MDQPQIIPDDNSHTSPFFLFWTIHAPIFSILRIQSENLPLSYAVEATEGMLPGVGRFQNGSPWLAPLGIPNVV